MRSKHTSCEFGTISCTVDLLFIDDYANTQAEPELSEYISLIQLWTSIDAGKSMDKMIVVADFWPYVASDEAQRA